MLPGSLPGTLLGKVLPQMRKEQLPTMFWLCSISINSVIKASGMTAVVLALLVGLYFLISGLQHPYVKRTTKNFSLRLMDFQAQAYPDARRKTRGVCQLLRVEQSRSPVRPLCNRKRFSSFQNQLSSFVVQHSTHLL